jgi:hypothetical protein
VRFRRANGIRDGDIFICCECKYLRLFLGGKEAQYLQWWWAMVQGIGCGFKCFLDTLEAIKEIKNHCDCR